MMPRGSESLDQALGFFRVGDRLMTWYPWNRPSNIVPAPGSGERTINNLEERLSAILTLKRIVLFRFRNPARPGDAGGFLWQRKKEIASLANLAF